MATSYAILLFLHSWLRWAVLGLLLAVVARAARSTPWAPFDDRLHVASVASVDLQLLLGLGLYFGLSPLTSAFFAAPGAAMRDTTLRFFGVEHLTSMGIAIALVHVGRARAKRAPVETRKKTALRWTAAALVFVLIGVPWPFLRYGRPLARAPEAGPAAPAGCPDAYVSRCAACHGATGRGDGAAAATLRPPPRDLGDGSWASGRSDEHLAAVIRDGGGAHGLSVAMPAHGDLSSEEIAELVACVRGLAAASR